MPLFVRIKCIDSSLHVLVCYPGVGLDKLIADVEQSNLDAKEKERAKVCKNLSQWLGIT